MENKCERTIAEYEEELCRSKEEKERQRRLLEAVLSPELRLHRADVQQLLVVKVEVPPEQQECSSSLVQEDPNPPHIKEEQEDHWTSQEGEQLQGLEEADTKFPFTPVPVKSEEDEEKPQSSQLHQRQTEQMETEADGEDCGGPEPAWNSDPDTHPEADTVYKTGDSSEPETDDSGDWEETREPQSGLKSLNIDDVPVSGSRCSADVQQLLVVKVEVPPEQQECSSSLVQEDPNPPHIKEEQEDHWTSQEGEQLQGLEEADTKFPFTPVPVKSEEDEEKPQSSQLHQRQTEQMETEGDGEDCGGSEPAWNSDPDTHPEADTVYKTGDSSEPETDDSGDWEETREPQSGLKSLYIDDVPVIQSLTQRENLENPSRICTREKPFSCSVCKKTFLHHRSLNRHMRIHTGEKPFSCSVCNKAFSQSGTLQKHRKVHTREKLFSCSVCKKVFFQSGHLKTHMQSHTGEKSSSCSVCNKAFIHTENLKRHMRIHTGEKPVSCSVCNKAFSRNEHLKKHMIIHTGERPFSCSVCKKAFTQRGTLQKHMKLHTGEKLFSCSVCKKAFLQNGNLKTHMQIHTGEKPFSCSVCKKAFNHTGHLKIHMRVHTGEKPFSCTVCEKAFTQRVALQKHMKVHTREKQPELLRASSQLFD